MHRTYADLIQVGECNGVLQRAIYMKQMENVGVRTWQQGLATDNHLRVWIFTSDQGSDQVVASKMLQRDVSESLNDIMITQWCLAHVLHLMAQFHLRFLYNGKMFSSLAKVINTWRSRGNPQKIKAGLQEYNHADGTGPKFKV